jgi:hypothetical protein
VFNTRLKAKAAKDGCRKAEIHAQEGLTRNTLPDGGGGGGCGSGGGGGGGGGAAVTVEKNLPSQKKRFSYSVKNRRWEEQTAVDSPTADLLASLLDNASSTTSSEKVCIYTICPLI